MNINKNFKFECNYAIGCDNGDTFTFSNFEEAVIKYLHIPLSNDNASCIFSMRIDDKIYIVNERFFNEKAPYDLRHLEDDDLFHSLNIYSIGSTLILKREQLTDDVVDRIKFRQYKVIFRR